MKLIDDKGKIFGLINIVDLLLILFIISVIYFGIVFVWKKGSVSIYPEDKKLQITMLVEATRPEIANYLKIGDTVKRRETQGKLGIIDSVKIEPAKIINYEISDQFPTGYNPSRSKTSKSSKTYKTKILYGDLTEKIIPQRKDVLIKIKTTGRQSKDIIATGGENLRVGEKLEIITPWFMGEAIVVELSVSSK